MRVLLIEDNPVNLKLVCYLVESAGHEVLKADTGRAGVDIARRERPDMILCDVNLPDLRGEEVLRQVKEDPLLESVPVIAVTALAMVGDRERLLEQGFTDYISKPIEPEFFAEQISRHAPLASPTALPPPGRAHGAPRWDALMVDDNPYGPRLARAVLECEGFRLRSAASVEEGWDQVRLATPDLLIIDYHLPDGTGLDLFHRLRAEPALARIPVLLITATCGQDIPGCPRDLAVLRLPLKDLNDLARAARDLVDPTRPAEG